MSQDDGVTVTVLETYEPQPLPSKDGTAVLRFSDGSKSLRGSQGEVRPGLVRRLVRYAFGRLSDSGFDVEGWQTEVGTLDGNYKPFDRHYWVEFTNVYGGHISVVGIHTNNGWPFLDHGFEAGSR